MARSRTGRGRAAAWGRSRSRSRTSRGPRGRMVIAQSSSGGLRTKITAEGGALGLFSAKHRKEVFRRAMTDVVERFIDDWLPLRFTDYIRRAPFNYRGGEKNRSTRPLVDTGLLEQAVAAGTTTRVSATGSRGARGKISIPVPLRPVPTRFSQQRIRQIIRVLSTVTSWEADDLGRVYAEAIGTEISAATETRTRSGRTRLHAARM